VIKILAVSLPLGHCRQVDRSNVVARLESDCEATWYATWVHRSLLAEALGVEIVRLLRPSSRLRLLRTLLKSTIGLRLGPIVVGTVGLKRGIGNMGSAIAFAGVRKLCMTCIAPLVVVRILLAAVLTPLDLNSLAIGFATTIAWAIELKGSIV